MPGRLLCLLALVAVVGCDSADPGPQPQPVAASPILGTSFDTSTAQTVSGQVVWEGEAPEVPRMIAYLRPHGPLPVPPPQPWPNPHAPRVHPSTQGVEHAVVFLRGVDPARSRPWDLPPARIEQRGHQIEVHQGDETARIGFVHAGATVEMTSTDSEFYTLHGRGAAFFSLRFVEANRPLRRVLAQPGRVELSSGLGRVWMRAHLFVVEHPYYTLTDDSGRFVLPRVPPGDYELVCWLPSWKEAGRDLDPNTSLPVRHRFRPAVEKRQRLTVKASEPEAVRFLLRGEDF